jgi:glycosyltransferase involved in cell wall biosynthesis
MKILQLSYSGTPKRNAPAGGGVGMFQNLKALVELGHEVELALIAPSEQVDAETRGLCREVHELLPREPPLWLRPLRRVLNPETFALRFPNAAGLRDAVARVADRMRPDAIWADSTFALALAPRDRYPVVFGNYDFLFRLKAVRLASRKRKLLRRPDAMTLAQLEAFELQLAREAAHVMCVSASDADFLNGQRIASTFIPIVGATIAAPTAEATDPPRFFLFGNHNTAHAAALSEIRHRVWPELARAGVKVEWHQIGKPPKHRDDDWLWMERSFDHVHGFVEDLATVFRIGDVSVVPYRHDTGFRTKFTIAAGYGVTSAGYEETFRCAPEFTNDVDCIVARGPAELAESFARIQRDRAWRSSLGNAARSLYDRVYTFEAQLPRYAAILAAASRSPSQSDSRRSTASSRPSASR